MKRFLLSHLICPSCLPAEHPLGHSVEVETAGDIITGQLLCSRCRRRFPVREGVAHLLPDPDGIPSGGQWRYEEGGMADRYLWSHYADLSGAVANGAANRQWEDLLAGSGGFALDAGCAVGRLTFAMAGSCSWAVGCDLSAGFVKVARKLARERNLAFSLPLEGNLRETFRIELPDSWPGENVEFVVADALRLPFARETFRLASSVNLLDRVAHPLAHLYEMNRVSRSRGASFLFASPFSWAASAAAEERWLGGKTGGEYCGRGEDNVKSLLEGNGGIITPPWRISGQGFVEWKMRSHCNHHELINSRYLLAER